MQRETRRSFFKKVMMGVALTPVLKVADLYAAVAASCPQGEPKDPKIKKKMINDSTAKRLDYVSNASDSKHKKYNKGELCGNCRFYKEHKSEPTWGKCAMAANRYVPSCGWCKSYKKAS